MGVSASIADQILDAMCRGVNFSIHAIFVQLHVGPPGRRGISNLAVERTRKLVGFAPPANATVATSTDATWTNIAGSEQVTHFSAWDAVTEGRFLFSGPLDVHPYLSGDTIVLPAGGLTSSLDP